MCFHKMWKNEFKLFKVMFGKAELKWNINIDEKPSFKRKGNKVLKTKTEIN